MTATLNELARSIPGRSPAADRLGRSARAAIIEIPRLVQASEPPVLCQRAPGPVP